MCAIIVFYLPFFRTSYNNIEFSKNKIVLVVLMIFGIFLSLNGPLIPGIVLTISFLMGLDTILSAARNIKNLSFMDRWQIELNKKPKAYIILILFISAMSIYSLYIGSNNSIFLGENIPIFERYARIPKGLQLIITQKIGFPVFIIMIIINLTLIKKYYFDNGKNIIKVAKWIGLFFLLYILLLPLGGYKNYRPYILRYDTIIPITIGMIFIYGITTYFLISNIDNKFKKLYLGLVLVFSFVFTFADKLESNKNHCEKEALLTISRSNDNIVELENDCTILSWDKITDPKKSKLNGQLLHLWNITNSPKLYMQK